MTKKKGAGRAAQRQLISITRSASASLVVGDVNVIREYRMPLRPLLTELPTLVQVVNKRKDSSQYDQPGEATSRSKVRTILSQGL